MTMYVQRNKRNLPVSIRPISTWRAAETCGKLAVYVAQGHLAVASGSWRCAVASDNMRQLVREHRELIRSDWKVRATNRYIGVLGSAR